ncbi:hypothetical protein [Enterococcus faecalis]
MNNEKGFAKIIIGLLFVLTGIMSLVLGYLTKVILSNNSKFQEFIKKNSTTLVSKLLPESAITDLKNRGIFKKNLRPVPLGATTFYNCLCLNIYFV